MFATFTFGSAVGAAAAPGDTAAAADPLALGSAGAVALAGAATLAGAAAEDGAGTPAADADAAEPGPASAAWGAWGVEQASKPIARRIFGQRAIGVPFDQHAPGCKRSRADRDDV